MTLEQIETTERRQRLAKAGLQLLYRDQASTMLALQLALDLGYENDPVVANELPNFFRKIAGLEIK